ncbi:hypothetical protein KR018_010422, partial [Drosophila ironensis]
MDQLEESVSQDSKSGGTLFSRLDRMLRRWLPGYGFLRGKRRPSSSSLVSGHSSSKEPTAGRRGNRQEIYLDTGIAKSEFCMQLEALLQSQLLKQQQQLLEQAER